MFPAIRAVWGGGGLPTKAKISEVGKNNTIFCKKLLKMFENT